MRARDVVGRRVVAVRQEWWKREDGAHTPGWVIQSIEFDDGSRMRFGVVEGEDDYGVEAIVDKPKRSTHEPWKELK